MCVCVCVCTLSKIISSMYNIGRLLLYMTLTKRYHNNYL